MKTKRLNLQNPDRSLHVRSHVGEGFMLIERERFEMYGRGKWGEQRVYLGLDEIENLIAFVAKERERCE